VATSTLVTDFFQDLENPDLYEKVEGVPVFAPHIAYKFNHRTGKKEYVKVTDDDIKEACQYLKDLEQARGSLVVVTPGHRNPDKTYPEQKQPPPWGYAKAAGFGTYDAPDGSQVPCMLTTLYLDRKVRAEDGTPANVAARTYPFRSVDFYSDDNRVSGIALLRRDPALDLGMISYQRGGLFCYAEENEMPEVEPAADAAAGLATGGAGAQAQPPPTNPPSSAEIPPTPQEEELSPEAAATAMSYMRHYERHHAPTRYMCERYQAEQGEGGQPSEHVEPEKAKTILREGEAKGKQKGMFGAAAGRAEQHARQDMDPTQYARELAIWKARVESLEKKRAVDDQERAKEKAASQLAQKRAIVREAQAEGYALDEKTILELHENSTPEQFAKHIDYIKAIAPTTAPTGRMIPIAAGNGTEGKTGVDLNGRNRDGRLPESFENQVMAYMRAHPGMGDWDEAEAAVRAAQPK
jgi:hypothetical protein